MKAPIFCIVVATFLVGAAELASAAAPLRATFVPVVVSVEADKITVQTGLFKGMKVTETETSKTKSQNINIRTYTVNKFTDITINGNRMKLSDVKAGMQVRVTQGTDPTVAASIVAKADPSVITPAH